MRTLVANSFHQISLCLVAGKRDFSRTPDFMTAPSSELWRPSFALRKAQLQSLAYAFYSTTLAPFSRTKGPFRFAANCTFHRLTGRFAVLAAARFLARTGTLSSCHHILPEACLRRTILCPQREATMRQSSFPLLATIVVNIGRSLSVLHSRQNFFAVKLNHVLLIFLTGMNVHDGRPGVEQFG